jgi:hypothetical protein
MVGQCVLCLRYQLIIFTSQETGVNIFEIRKKNTNNSKNKIKNLKKSITGIKKN